jgi:hypothetical protein
MSAIITQKETNPTTPPIPQQDKKPTLQPRHAIIPQPVLWQHAPDRAPQNLPSSPLLHHALHGDLLEAARPRRVRVVLLLLHLLAGRVQLRQPRADDVVAAVRAGVVDRLVLAHEGEGDGGGQAAERARVGAGVDEVPGARVGEAGLRDDLLVRCSRVGVHRECYGDVPCRRIGTLWWLWLPCRAQRVIRWEVQVRNVPRG